MIAVIIVNPRMKNLDYRELQRFNFNQFFFLKNEKIKKRMIHEYMHGFTNTNWLLFYLVNLLVITFINECFTNRKITLHPKSHIYLRRSSTAKLRSLRRVSILSIVHCDQNYFYIVIIRKLILI